MREAWLGLVEKLLRPARPRLAECRDVAERLGAVRSAARTRALVDCQARIEAARADVFTAKDGIVRANMTALEREWRQIARGDREGEAMDLWAAIAPPTWLDRKRWRGTPEPLEAAVLLASDPDGVEMAESAHAGRITWRPLSEDFAGMPALVGGDAIDEAVHDAVLARFPERPYLARAVGLAARSNARTYWNLWRAGYVLGAPGTLEFPLLA